MEDERLKEYLTFQLNRNIVALYKKLFEIVEDMKQEHTLMLHKVEKKTSKEFADSIDYLNDNKINYIRKKILDSGNDAIRNIENNFKAVNINLK